MSKSRYLRKTDDGTLYAWTETLAARADMVEVEGPAAPKSAKPAANSGEGGNPNPDGGTGGEGGEKLDPLAITDKAELKALLKASGAPVSGNPSLTTLQQALVEALKGEGE